MAYKKKGATYKEVVRCPLCGKLSPIAYFNLDHKFGVYQFKFAGRSSISCKLLNKSFEFMEALKESLVNRMEEIIEEFSSLSKAIGIPVKTIEVNTIHVIPKRIIPLKVVMR